MARFLVYIFDLSEDGWQYNEVVSGCRAKRASSTMGLEDDILQHDSYLPNPLSSQAAMIESQEYQQIHCRSSHAFRGDRPYVQPRCTALRRNRTSQRHGSRSRKKPNTLESRLQSPLHHPNQDDIKNLRHHRPRTASGRRPPSLAPSPVRPPHHLQPLGLHQLLRRLPKLLRRRAAAAPLGHILGRQHTAMAAVLHRRL